MRGSFGAALALLLVLGAARAEERSTGCAPEAGETRTVARVPDGETLILDGRAEVRLIGALAPRAWDAAAGAAEWPLAERARDTLERLVAGRSVRIAFAGRRTDRYGRLLAHVFAGAQPPGESAIWVQGEMLKQGLARAYALDGSTQCLAELLAHERTARDSAAGLWAEAAYAVRSAQDLAALLRASGTFQVVEGKVLAASEMRGTVFLNFGEDWRQDFTVSLRREARRQLASAGLQTKSLEGRIVRVRGWIVRRGGPLIELSHPAEIELIDGGAKKAEPEAEARPPPRRRRPRAPPGQGAE